MSKKNQNPDQLNDFLKLWIKSKIGQFYKQDPYLKYLNAEIALSHFHETLVQSKTITQLLNETKKFDQPSGIRFSRKNDKKSLFEYPSLSLHIESLLVLWPQICSLYEQNSLIDLHNNRFGHRPNLGSNFSDSEENPRIKEKDIKINCPLKIAFQDDYPAFKHATVSTANDILTNSKVKNPYVLIIQSDIQKYFHNLSLTAIDNFLLKHFPSLHGDSKKFFERMREECNFSSLPIGWSLSGIYSDLVAVKFHESFSKNIDDQLQKILKSLSAREELLKIMPESEISDELVSDVGNFIKTSNIKYKADINYVDDLIFMLEFNVSEQFKEKHLLKFFEKIITNIVLLIAEDLINSIFSNEIKLTLYRPDDEKGKHFSFDKTNIDTLGSNFFSVANNTPSDPAESNIWTRLDEFLLPADNELTLNERTQFFMHLANLRNKILDGEIEGKKDLDDIFNKILLKIQGSEAKYVSSVLRLVESLAISNKNEYGDYCIKMLSKIFAKLQTSNKTLDLWLKYFSGYFRIFTKMSFDPEIDFFDDFDKFSLAWYESNENEHDWYLLRAIKTSYLIRMVSIKNKNEKLVEIMSRRRNKSFNRGLFSEAFSAININQRSKFIRVHINRSSDSLSVASLIRAQSKRKDISPDSYIQIGKKIKQKTNTDYASQFYNLTAYSVIPRWTENETSSFLKNLPSVTSLVHSEVIRKLLKKASSQAKEIGSSYFHRLYHMRDNLILTESSRLKNIPVAYGKGDISNYRSVVFYLTTLESNSSQDLKKAYLSSLIPLESSRDFSFHQVPVALRRTGLAFYKIIREIAESKLKGYSTEQVKKMASELSKEDYKEHKDTGSNLEKFKNDYVSKIDLFEISELYGLKKENSLLMTLCPIGMEAEQYFDAEQGLSFKAGMHEILDLKIESAILEAKKRRSDVIVFPELTLPRRYLYRYLDMCARRGLILIAGLEYTADSVKNCRNSTIISFPTDPSKDPYKRSYVAFEQDKHYPAAKEKRDLEQSNVYKYYPGRNLFIFYSKRFSNFAILTCSDFLSLKLRLKLQEEIQTVFVPAQNLDMTTYNHIAESSIRDLHCFAVICNNQEMGGSFVYAPFRKPHKRAVFRKDGATVPEFLTMKWFPEILIDSQKADSQHPFEEVLHLADIKQTPPDWGPKYNPKGRK